MTDPRAPSMNCRCIRSNWRCRTRGFSMPDGRPRRHRRSMTTYSISPDRAFPVGPRGADSGSQSGRGRAVGAGSQRGQQQAVWAIRGGGFPRQRLPSSSSRCWRPISVQTCEVKAPERRFWVWRVVEGIAAQDHQGPRILCRAAVIDIIQQKRADELAAANKALEAEIAARVQADSLRASEEQFRRAIEDAPIPAHHAHRRRPGAPGQPYWTELTGYTLADVPTVDAWLTRAYGKGADAVRSHVQQLFVGKSRTINVEFAILVPATTRFSIGTSAAFVAGNTSRPPPLRSRDGSWTSRIASGWKGRQTKPRLPPKRPTKPRVGSWRTSATNCARP